MAIASDETSPRSLAPTWSSNEARRLFQLKPLSAGAPERQAPSQSFLQDSASVSWPPGRVSYINLRFYFDM